MTRKLLCAGALCLLAGVAVAGDRYDRNPPPRYSPPHFNAPEIDPASASSALTLLLGGLTVLRSRSSRKK